jgi:hypothetical protein
MSEAGRIRELENVAEGVTADVQTLRSRQLLRGAVSLRDIVSGADSDESLLSEGFPIISWNLRSFSGSGMDEKARGEPAKPSNWLRG